MIWKSLILLVLAAVILDIPATLAQRESVTSRRQQLLQKQQEQQQQAGLRRRLISRNRINSARKQTSAPVENETTQPIQEEPVLTTQALPVATEPPVQGEIPEEISVIHEEPPVPEIPEPVPVVPVEPVRTRTKNPAQTRPSSRIPAAPKQAIEQNEAQPKARPSKTKEEERKPIVETIRRYNFENEDGSFTFGYENADGSFKEETRGADCVVRGKYGYIDPDGVRREFTYVSGNPCDPNKKDEEEEADTSEEVSKPVSQQRRPNIPNTPRPVVQRPQVVNQVHVPTVQDSSEEHDITEVLRNNPTPQRIRPANNRPVDNGPRIQRPRPVAPVTNHEDSSRFESVIQPSRPASAPNTIAVPVKSPTPAFDFDAEVQRFSGSLPASRTPVQRPAPRPVEIEDEDNEPKNRPAGTRSFTSELVFDRNANQFHSAVLQRIPEANTEIAFREKLVAFVSTTTTRPEIPPIPVVRPTTPPPVRESRPERPVVQEPEIDFNSFGPPVQEIERQRLIQQQRQQQSFVPQPQSFNPQPAFNPGQPGVQQQFAPQQRFPPQQPQFNPVNPFAPGISPQQFFGPQQFNQQRPAFNPPQPQQFAPPQIVQPQNTQNRAQSLRPSGSPEHFATGQIDSFLSSLG